MNGRFQRYIRRTLALSAIIATLAPTVDAAIIISEVLYNEVGSDTGGEWIEIYNNGAGAVDLTNFKIGDEETSGATSTTEGMFQFPAAASIAAGGVQIVATSAAVFNTNYGFKPTYEVADSDPAVPNMTVYSTWDPDGNTLNMSNTNDQALILNDTDTVIDAVSWGNTFAFNPGLNADAEGDGQSYLRTSVLVDTNTAADWRLGTPSSPGNLSVPEPSSLVLFLLLGLLWPRPSRG